jgi:N-carbamoyl-L-amino-acid hydrolase
MHSTLVERVGTAVDSERLRQDIERTGTFGAVDGPGRGRTALPGDEASEMARAYLVERLEAAGCSVRVDPIGNIVGRWVPPGADPAAAPVAAGSHLDSVLEGGIFDGPLGVFAALESVRAMTGQNTGPGRPLWRPDAGAAVFGHRDGCHHGDTQ